MQPPVRRERAQDVRTTERTTPEVALSHDSIGDLHESHRDQDLRAMWRAPSRQLTAMRLSLAAKMAVANLRARLL